MATSTTLSLPFLVLSLVLIVSCSLINICGCTITETAADHQIPSTVNAKTATIQYWNNKFGTNKSPPRLFLSKLSTLSPLQFISSIHQNVAQMINHEAKAEKTMAGSDAADSSMAESKDEHYMSASSDASNPSVNVPNRCYQYAGLLFCYYAADSSNNIKLVTDKENKEKTEQVGIYNSKDSHVHDSNAAPGVFFRESNMKKGTVMHMVDLKALTPPRYHFLPRSVASMIPFSAAAIRDIFRIPADTTMGKYVEQGIALCNMRMSGVEVTRCASAAEDMIDFAVSTLGSPDNIVVKSTENTNGSGGNILIGDVKAVNVNGNDNFTEALSCHQTKFPYMLQYCHMVPKVRVYEAEILDVETKNKINSGIAICHVDTSYWDGNHLAFAMLGSSPGKIEVCHWIFPWDMAWTVAAATE